MFKSKTLRAKSMEFGFELDTAAVYLLLRCSMGVFKFTSITCVVTLASCLCVECAENDSIDWIFLCKFVSI